MRTLDDRLVLIGDALERGARHATERRRARLRSRRIAAVVATVAVLCAGTAIASSGLLGGPAPAAVQSAIDRFIPANWDGEMAPAPSGATAVARFGDDVLYHLPARDGKSVCFTVILADHVPAHAVTSLGCEEAGNDSASFPTGIAGTAAPDGRQIFFGRVNAPPDGSLWASLDGGPAVQIPLGVDGYFLAEASSSDPGADPATTRPTEARLTLRDGRGAELASRPLILFRPGAFLSPPAG